MTLSNVGGAGFSAMTFTSAKSKARPSSNAAGKRSALTLSQGGTPLCGPPQGASIGLASACALSFLTFSTAAPEELPRPSAAAGAAV
jgi:hypothetical protein